MRRPYAQNFPLEGPLVSIKEAVMFRRIQGLLKVKWPRSQGAVSWNRYAGFQISICWQWYSMGHANNSPGTPSGLLPVSNKVLSEHSSSILCLYNLGLHLSFYSIAECMWSEPHSLELITLVPSRKVHPFPRTIPWSVRRASVDVTRTKHFQTGLTPVAKTKPIP